MGRTIMVQAVSEGRSKKMRLLLNCGANAQWRDADGNTLLHYAIEGMMTPSRNVQNFAEEFQTLMNNGVSFADKNNAGETPVFALWWMLNDPLGPPLSGFALNFMTQRIGDILDIVLTRADNMFEKNNLGKSFLAHTPVDVHFANHPDYIIMENMLQRYKSLEQAQTINTQLNIANNSNGKKAKI